MAANKYINLYMGDVTEGGTDGTQVSLDGAGTSPLAFSLDATDTTKQSNILPVAIRCESGYATTGDTVITFKGTNAGLWGVAAKQSDAFSSSYTISSSIGAKNVLFYVQAKVNSDEKPLNDTSVKIQVTTKVKASA